MMDRITEVTAHIAALASTLIVIAGGVWPVKNEGREVSLALCLSSVVDAVSYTT